MEAQKETFDTLWKCCSENRRLCPMPMRWNDLYDMLDKNGDGELLLPLILNAWHEASLIEKNLRFRHHILWASDNNQIKKIGIYLRSLKEEDWAHY